jgi:hypothetical protein
LIASAIAATVRLHFERPPDTIPARLRKSNPRRWIMKTQILAWDRRGQIDITELNQALGLVFDGQRPCVVNVPATGSDQYAVIVASERISEHKAHELWNALWNGRGTYDPGGSSLGGMT